MGGFVTEKFELGEQMEIKCFEWHRGDGRREVFFEIPTNCWLCGAKADPSPSFARF
jgi:hypothetical protein